MRVSRWILLWAIVVVVLVVIELAQVFGFLRAGDIITNFFVLLIVLVVIAILAAIGAGFLGIFFTHRLFSSRGFTPFEEEMLKMREELKRVTALVESIAEKVGLDEEAGEPPKP